MECPGCGSRMTSETLEGHLGASVVLDFCSRCQAFWFDPHESLQLSPGSTLRLFKIIGEEAAKGRPGIQGGARCPRCRSQLLLTHDMQRSTRFQYWRCARGHGRLITFYDFLREKDFIRPLSLEQVEELRRSIQSVNCGNCGAPVDIASGSACTHCGSPLSMLDMSQAGRLIAELQAADCGRPIDPDLPLRLERARKDVEKACLAGRTPAGPVADGLSALIRLLTTRID
jgi:hypothetical protein